MENTNATDWFDGANVTDEKQVGNVALAKKNVTQIEVSFKSGNYNYLCYDRLHYHNHHYRNNLIIIIISSISIIVLVVVLLLFLLL